MLALAVASLVPAETHKGVPKVKEARAGDVKTGPLVLLAIGIGLGSTAATPLGAFIVESAVAAGIEPGRAGLLLALGSAVGITVRMLFGYLADGIGGGRLRLVAGMLGAGTIGFVLLATRMDSLLVVGTVLAFGAGWGWPGLFNFAIVKTNPGAPAAATGITQTGASAGRGLGTSSFRPNTPGHRLHYRLDLLRRDRPTLCDGHPPRTLPAHWRPNSNLWERLTIEYSKIPRRRSVSMGNGGF